MFLGEVIPLVIKNTLRKILGSKSEKFKKIEARPKVRNFYKKERSIGNWAEFVSHCTKQCYFKWKI